MTSEALPNDVVYDRLSSAFSWRATATACGFLALFGILAIGLGTQHAAISGGLFSIMCGSTVVAQLGCACIVLGHGYTTRSPDSLLIGTVYLVAGLLGAQYLLAAPNLAAPLLAVAGNSATPYLWIFWQSSFSVLAVLSIALRLLGDGERRPSPVGAAVATVGIVVGAIALAFAAPFLAHAMSKTAAGGRAFGQYRNHAQLNIALATAAVDVAGIVAFAAFSRLRRSISRTFALALIASLIDILVTLTSGPYSYGWYAGTLLMTIASSTVLIAFVSEFTWRRAIERANVAHSDSASRERQRTQERLLYLAYHDELTGINNRSHWQDVLGRQIATQADRAESTPIAVLFIDLDRFKEVNDAAGHAHGDAILIDAAKRLQACAGPHDTLGRLGGDEFALVCRANDPDVLAAKILEAIRIPFVIDGRPSEIGATIGIARFPQDGESVEELLRNADQALYHGKRNGGDSFNGYDVHMSEDRRRKRVLREALSHALERREFFLTYQPIFDFETLECESAEALMRWQSDSLGSISPAVFIPIAEETELMRGIGRWTIETAISQLGTWHRQHASPLPARIAVNISARQLRDPSFFEHLTDLLRHHAVAAHRLELEITESAAMADTDAAIELLARCRELGARITLDDFGTHFSSLTYLQRLPVDSIKIDRSFVAGLPFAEGDAAIVRNIINLGHDMHRTIVAEGIETREQFDWLRRAKCDFAQGFLLARPIVAREIERRVVENFSASARREIRDRVALADEAAIG